MNGGYPFYYWLGGGGCCCFLLLLVVGLIVWKMMSRKRPPPGSSATLTDNRPAVTGATPAVGRMAQYGNIISEISNDGFYILNQYLTPGSLVHYRYRSGGGWVTRSVPYQPGPRGHYVYLGAMPQDLQITDVVPAVTSTESPEDPMRTMIMPSGTVPRPAASPQPPKFPSAY